jgi:mannose/cellobiose epimerase-like protein (N-acyl-D-glucosamine 2-epimerase family)
MGAVVIARMAMISMVNLSLCWNRSRWKHYRYPPAGHWTGKMSADMRSMHVLQVRAIDTVYSQASDLTYILTSSVPDL